MKRDKVEEEFASQLKKLRTSHGLSVAKMADKLYLDERTWTKYERGESAPTVPEMVKYYEEFGEDILRAALDCIYTDIYKDIEQKSVDDMRDAIIHFFQHVATDRMVKEFCFVAFGNHGSNFQPQLAEWVILNHLPMDYRVAIAKSLITFYRMAEARHEVVCPTEAPCDFGTVVEAIRQGLEAVGQGRNSYTTAFESEAKEDDGM